MLKKNDVVTLEITGLTNEGNGVGKADGIAVFVPLTAVGDVIECRIVKVKKELLLRHYREYHNRFGRPLRERVRRFWQMRRLFIQTH